MQLGRIVQVVGAACLVTAVLVQSHGAGAQSSKPQFEVASVKRLAGGNAFGVNQGGPGTSDPARIMWTLSLGALIVRAYGIREDQLIAPEWVTNGNKYGYSIAATMPAGTSKEQFQMMLQDLLTERFHLALHHQTKKFPGYELVVAPGGPRVRRVPADNEVRLADRAPVIVNGVQPGDDGFPKLRPGAPSAMIMPKLGTWGVYRGRFHESIEQFLLAVPGYINQSNGDPVSSALPRLVDKTGLSGVYDFTLEFSGGMFFDGGGPVARVLSERSADQLASDPIGRRGGGITIFTAFEKQLGLQLKKSKDVDVDIFVIDHADMDPVVN
jgi:uncharacterized protein (TIGR03435 family)